jgi:RNA polymerase sigma factor (sigma-70 family)
MFASESPRPSAGRFPREIRPARAEPDPDSAADPGAGSPAEDAAACPDGAWSTDTHVHRWQAGDDAAFEALYLRFAPLLARRVQRHRSWSLLRRHHQVDDVVQAVWERVIPAARHVFTPSGPGSFLAFLGTLADRTIVDLSRWEGAAKRGEGAPIQGLDGPAGGRAAACESPTSHARASEIRALAQRILNEREREVWELVEADGYSLEETGLALECSASAARGVYFRARRKLILALGEAEADGAAGA